MPFGGSSLQIEHKNFFGGQPGRDEAEENYLFKTETYGAAETFALGQRFAAYLPPGTVVTLSGELGAGKTAFAKGVAKGLGVQEHITSPTFTIINEYPNQIPFYHMDAYRLDDENEIWELGLEEYFDAPGVVLVEWPERIAAVLPAELIRIDFTKAWQENGEEYRILFFTAQGAAGEKLIGEFAKNENTRG